MHRLAILRLLLTAAALLAAVALPWVGSVRAAGMTVAVARFYAPTPVTTYTGLVPEEYASADMSSKLSAAAGGRFAVVPREQVRADEGGLRWHDSDVLRFARLAELARATEADHVVVGWIQSLVLDRLGGGGADLDFGGGAGGGVLSGLAVVTVQVFDASQGRIVYQTKLTGHSLGTLPYMVVENAIDDAVRRAVPEIAAPLTAVAAQ
ncbi:MAG TPA: hypothetical protein VJT33_00035 [bacterium]|nr:hypothetical protein [bacterium]